MKTTLPFTSKLGAERFAETLRVSYGDTVHGIRRKAQGWVVDHTINGPCPEDIQF